MGVTRVLLLLAMVTERKSPPVRSLGHDYQSDELFKHGNGARSDEVCT